LWRPHRLWYVLQVDPHTGPGAVTATHRIHQNVGGFEERRHRGMTRLPALDAGQRILPLASAPDFDQRMNGRAAA